MQEIIKKAMSPTKEVLDRVALGDYHERSTMFKNTCDRVFEYAAINPSQQLETTKGTLYRAYNAITEYYQNVVNCKDDCKLTCYSAN